MGRMPVCVLQLHVVPTGTSPYGSHTGIVHTGPSPDCALICPHSSRLKFVDYPFNYFNILCAFQLLIYYAIIFVSINIPTSDLKVQRYTRRTPCIKYYRLFERSGFAKKTLDFNSRQHFWSQCLARTILKQLLSHCKERKKTTPEFGEKLYV